MKGLEPCCDSLKAALEVNAKSYGGIFVEEDGEISVMGCCGGGCNVLNDIQHCPFCGRRLQLTIGIITRPIETNPAKNF